MTSTTITWVWRSFDALSPEELYDILALRQAVFIIEQQCIYPDMDYRDQQAMHLLGKINNELCTYVRLLSVNLPYPNAISFGRVATCLTARGNGLAKEAIKQTMLYLQKIHPSVAIVISAQLYLQKFYAFWGFKAVGEPYDEDGVPHIKMQKESA
jgi:ElaA protein